MPNDYSRTIAEIKKKYGVVGNDKGLIAALERAVKASKTYNSVFITGENGVGKEVFSKIIHDNSDRKNKKMIPVNCGALPSGTIESALFGHKKGSFTGAEKDHKGYFEEANGGTIFLDEIGDLPLDMQVKLLRVLENGEILPVGSSEPIKVNVRVVAATNIDIQQLIHQGRFRQDLFYRLNQVPIMVPPLRERPDDIKLLFCYFAGLSADEKKGIKEVEPEAYDYLRKYPWNGNIRELRNLVSQLYALEDSNLITVEVLKSYLSYYSEEKTVALYHDPHLPSDRDLLLKVLELNQTVIDMRKDIDDLQTAVRSLLQMHPAELQKYQQLLADHPHGINEEDAAPVHLYTDGGHPMSSGEEEEFQEGEEVKDEEDMTSKHGNNQSDSLNINDLTLQSTIRALERHAGRRKEAADELGISVRTLYRRIKDYNLEDIGKK